MFDESYVMKDHQIRINYLNRNDFREEKAVMIIYFFSDIRIVVL